MSYLPEHMQRLSAEVTRMVAEVPLYSGYGAPSGDVSAWLAAQPVVSKRELRRGFPKSLVRKTQDLNAAMQAEQVTLLATSGTTADRLQVIWEWSWWDPQEREAMRLNARIRAAMARDGYREAVLTTPACGGGTCHIGDQSLAERTIDGMVFFNQTPDPSYWTAAECERMQREWQDFAPRAVEADPAYLALFCRDVAKRGGALSAPEFVSLTYETTTQALRRDIARVIDAPLYQLYGATEAGVLFMECERGRLHANERHAHIELLPLGDRLARVIVTTLGREWMPLLRYEVGDVVRVAESVECACGLPVNGPLLERVEGRFSDCVRVGEQTITPLMLDDAITSATPAIEQWQLSGDTLSCVGGDATAAAVTVSTLLARTVRGERTSAIAPEASGKYRLVRDAR
jgi:phenylacetate-CoA ligase